MSEDQEPEREDGKLVVSERQWKLLSGLERHASAFELGAALHHDARVEHLTPASYDRYHLTSADYDRRILLVSLLSALDRLATLEEALRGLLSVTFGTGDWACAECRPDSHMLVPDFRCVVHEARAALAGTPKP